MNKQTANKQTDRALKNHPGIYKRFKFEEDSKTWIDTGKYRAIRRVVENGVPKKEHGVFDNLADAKAFRAGTAEKVNVGGNVHRNNLETDNVLTFGGLVQEWKSFHYLQLEPSTQQMYDKRLPNLDYLKQCPIRSINAGVVDDMVKYWVAQLPKGKQRETFEKELNLLKVILIEITNIIEFPVIPKGLDRAFLHQKYVVERLSTSQIAALISSSRFAVQRALRFCRIPVRAPHKPHGKPSQPSYGERFVKGRLTPFLKEQRTIDVVHELRQQGMSLRQIGRLLTKMKVPTKCNGQAWHPQMVARALESGGQ